MLEYGRIHLPRDVVARRSVLYRHLYRVPRAPGTGADGRRAIAAAERLVDEDVAAAAGTGWTPPESLTDREYSGRFVLRMSPELHAHLAVEAAEQGVSLNQWVLQRLTNRRR